MYNKAGSDRKHVDTHVTWKARVIERERERDQHGQKKQHKKFQFLCLRLLNSKRSGGKKYYEGLKSLLNFSEAVNTLIGIT